ncbi:MAG TPA: MBL fold metallo-hydrolase [Solirubrobacteraceae bacterium]|nr:MBL fold metallo-hydrolase [Solirubrobacteraceae bacterium]
MNARPDHPRPGHPLPDDIHPIAVPTPFAIGSVNAFLLEGTPLTLIDSGPNYASALNAIEDALADIGRGVEDLELLLITHQHGDHLGLAQTLVRRSGAEVACLDLLPPFVSDYRRSVQSDDALGVALMRRHGVPERTIATLRVISSLTSHLGSSFEVQRPLPDGATVRAGTRELQLLLRPGHSATDTVYLDAGAGLAFAGDHLLASISSNPLIGNPPGGPVSGLAADRPRALPTYLDSLRQTRELSLDVVLTGHGEPVLDHRALIDSRLHHHERRAERILGYVQAGPLSAHAIAEEIWGQVAHTQAYLTLCEVIGHLDLLVAAGVAVEEEGEETTTFSSAR